MIYERKALNVLFRYDSMTGRVWRFFPGRQSAYESDKETCFPRWKETGLGGHSGYCSVKFSGKGFPLQRVIWFIVHGAWPINEIDHKDRNRKNNRLSNLRDVPRLVQAKNHGKQKDNTSEVTGVSWKASVRMWCVRIMVNHKQNHVGCYEDFCQAVEARLAAEAQYGFHPSHGGV